MRHLQLSKHLYRNQNKVPAVKSMQVSIGAAGHTLIVRRLQLAVLTNLPPQLSYASLSEREAVYPTKGYSKAQILAVSEQLQSIARNLADNDVVQLRQPTASNVDYRLRFVRCNLTPAMRQLTERLPDFDFDPFTINAILSLDRTASKEKHESRLRLSGLPIRLGRTTTGL